MYWKSWELAFRNFPEPATDSGYVSQFIDAAFNENIFLWDTCSMTMFCNYAHPLVPGLASLDNFYAKQHADGEICREINRSTGQDCANTAAGGWLAGCCGFARSMRSAAPVAEPEPTQITNPCLWDNRTISPGFPSQDAANGRVSAFPRARWQGGVLGHRALTPNAAGTLRLRTVLPASPDCGPHAAESLHILFGSRFCACERGRWRGSGWHDRCADLRTKAGAALTTWALRPMSPAACEVRFALRLRGSRSWFWFVAPRWYCCQRGGS